MLVTFGLSDDNTGFDDVNILSTSSWSWITQYNANAAWLAGNTTSAGVPKSKKKKKGFPLINPYISHHFVIDNDTMYDPNSNTNKNDQNISSETRIKAGVIAGVVSGGVVIVSSILH